MGRKPELSVCSGVAMLSRSHATSGCPPDTPCPVFLDEGLLAGVDDCGWGPASRALDPEENWISCARGVLRGPFQQGPGSVPKATAKVRGGECMSPLVMPDTSSRVTPLLSGLLMGRSSRRPFHSLHLLSVRPSCPLCRDGDDGDSGLSPWAQVHSP